MQKKLQRFQSALVLVVVANERKCHCFTKKLTMYENATLIDLDRVTTMLELECLQFVTILAEKQSNLTVGK